MKKKFEPKDVSTLRCEYYAVSKDGMFKEKLKDYLEALKIKREGKYNFGVDFRELLMVEMECTVYEKKIQTTKRWEQI